jgi:glucokinase
VSLTSPADLLLGIDIGATKIAAGIAAGDGRIRDRLVVPTPRHDPDRLVEEVAALVERLRRGAAGPAAIGVGACGRVKTASGEVNTSLALGWRHPVALRARLAARTGCPVFLDNDVNAGALGEHRWGAARDLADVVYVSVGTGIGAGILIGGRLYRGAGGAAGEVGHMVVDADGPPCPCGNRGCLEVLASGQAVGATASAAIAGGAASPALEALARDGTAITARDVFAAASGGDAYARGLVQRTGEWLAVAVVNLVNLFDPQRVVLGGGLTHTGDLLVAAVRDALGRRAGWLATDPKVLVPAALGPDTGVAGAAAVALDALRTQA